VIFTWEVLLTVPGNDAVDMEGCKAGVRLEDAPTFAAIASRLTNKAAKHCVYLGQPLLSRE
jgi:hypothetical protein